ncbi:hypothetical protein TNCV_1023261 [Trichonephila clavipes]|nr:hypothetical protein TNCV_1023261 [Trichonephila clavipes]
MRSLILDRFKRGSTPPNLQRHQDSNPCDTTEKNDYNHFEEGGEDLYQRSPIGGPRVSEYKRRTIQLLDGFFRRTTKF